MQKEALLVKGFGIPLFFFYFLHKKRITVQPLSCCVPAKRRSRVPFDLALLYLSAGISKLLILTL